MDRRRLRLLPTILAAVAALTLSACGSGGPVAAGGASQTPGAVTLTVYSGQHEALGTALAEAFEKESGIHVELRSGSDGELSNQIVEEGGRSKADIFLSEEPGPIAGLATKGVFAPVEKSTLEVPDQRFVPSDGLWAPWAARSRVYFYNPEKIAEADLPNSILDLADPKWNGRFAYAPSGAFKSTTTYLIDTIGKDATLKWLEAIKANGVNEQKNGKVRDSVEAGTHEFGLSNHYYWYIMAKEKGGEDKVTSRVHYLNNDDAGALMLASGAAVLKSSQHQPEAQKFLAWLVSAQGGQKILAEQTPQFPLTPGVNSSFGLPALDTLTFPKFDQGSLGNGDEANELLKQSGIN